MELEQVNQRLSQLDKEYNHAVNSMQTNKNMGKNQVYFEELFEFQQNQLESSKRELDDKKTDIINELDRLKAQLDEARYDIERFDEELGTW